MPLDSNCVFHEEAATAVEGVTALPPERGQNVRQVTPIMEILKLTPSRPLALVFTS